MGKGKGKSQGFRETRKPQGNGEMGKPQGNGEMGKKEENNTEKKEEKNTEKKGSIVLKVNMHCEGCANKVFSCLKRIDGVEEVNVDRANHKVTVRGKNVDPLKVLKRIKKKYSRNVELISPKPKANDEKDKKEKGDQKKEPPVKTVALKVSMHCEGCAHDIQRYLEGMKGILTAEPDIGKSRVTVRGAFDESKLVETISKRLRKHVEVVKQGNGKEKKEEKKGTIKENLIYYPPQRSLDYNIHLSQIFSDENVFSCSIM